MPTISITTRASAIGQHLKCPASQVQPAITIERDEELSRLGTAAHEGLANEVHHYMHQAPDSMARKHSVDKDTLWSLVMQGRRAWNTLKDWFPAPQTEVALSHTWDFKQPDGSVIHLTLTGHVDVLSYVEAAPARGIYRSEVRALDWKTGFRDADHMPQMRAYGALAMEKFPEAERSRAIIARLRDLSAGEQEVFDREELAEWLEQAAKRLADTSVYSPGEHCAWCNRAHECPAKAAMLRQWAESLGTPPDMDDPQAVGLLLERARALGKEADAIAELIKAHVMATGEVEFASNGQDKLLVIEQQERKDIDFRRGEKILRETLGGRLPQVLSVKKSDVEKMVREDAPRGEKGHAVQDLMEQLESAGAIKTKLIDKLEIRRRVEAKEVVS